MNNSAQTMQINSYLFNRYNKSTENKTLHSVYINLLLIHPVMC